MELTIIPNKQTIIKDSISLILADLTYPNCNAVQWHTDHGFYEYDSGNVIFTDQSKIQLYIDTFEAEMQKQNTKPDVNEWEESTYSNGSWSVQNKTDALDIVKQVKCTEIDVKRYEMQSLPLEYTFPDGQIGHIQRRDHIDERNIQAVATAAQSLVLVENTTSKVRFTDQENIKHFMAGQEGLAFGAHVFDNYAANQDNARAHKDNVNILTTINEVKSYDYSSGWL